MRRRKTLAVALAVLTLGGCASAPEQDPTAALPPSPIAPRNALGDTASSGLAGASAAGADKVESFSTIPPVLSSGSLGTPSRQNSTSSRRLDAGAGFQGTTGDGSEHGAVGPAATYEDAAGDADGASHVGALSQSSFDIVSVAWRPVLYEEQRRRGYSTSITIAGPPREDGAYVSYGYFVSDIAGESCELYAILELGTAAYANAFCGSVQEGTRRFVGRMDGRAVTSSPTAAGGTTLVGTFDDPVVPYMLEASRTLYNLSAFTACVRPAPTGAPPKTRCGTGRAPR